MSRFETILQIIKIVIFAGGFIYFAVKVNVIIGLLQ